LEAAYYAQRQRPAAG
ncbi:transposase, partial [Mycobacterium tuberculosis TKK_04_0149]